MAITARKIRAGLRRVREKLLNGTIEAHEFDMGEILVKRHCGTVACIGGWLAIELGFESTKEFSLVAIAGIADDGADDNRLYDLFFNFGNHERTRRGAATAIRRYLDGEKQVWR